MLIRHFEAESNERTAYLKMRRAIAGVTDDQETETDLDEEETDPNATISPERYAEMSAAEDLLLTITTAGYGKTSSSHDYRIQGRGGSGLKAMELASRKLGEIIACFPIDIDDQVMLATSTGQSIRCPVDGISFRSRGAGGVKVFDTGAGEEVVSVARIAEQAEEDDSGEDAAPDDTGSES